MERIALEQEAESINAIGDKLMKKKQYLEAITYYQESVDLMCKAGNIKRAKNFEKELEQAIANRAARLNTYGDKYYKQKNYKEAMDVYQEAWDMLQKAGSRWIKKYGKEFATELKMAKNMYALHVLLPQAQAMSYSGKWEDSVVMVHDIVGYLSDSYDEKTNLQLNLALCEIHERWADSLTTDAERLLIKKKFAEATEKYAKAFHHISLAQNDDKRNDIKKALSEAFKDHAEETNNHAKDLMKQEKFEDAATIYEQCLDLAEESGDKRLIEHFRKDLENAYVQIIRQINDEASKLYSNWKYEEAANLYNKAVEIAKESKRKDLIENFKEQYDDAILKWAESKLVRGNEHEILREYEDAIVDYEEGMKIIENAYSEKIVDQFIKVVYSIYIKIADKIQSRAEGLYNLGEYEKSCEQYDICVKLAYLGQHNRKLQEYRKKRDQVMEKLPATVF